MTYTDDRATRVREVRRRLAQEGPPRTRGQEGDFETVTVPEEHCDQRRDGGTSHPGPGSGTAPGSLRPQGP